MFLTKRYYKSSVLFVTLGTRGFSRVQREFSVLAEGRHIFGRRPNSRAAKPREKRVGHYKDLTETGNRARKVSGTQGIYLYEVSWDFAFDPTVDC